jgi:hypothetical protein
MGGENFAKLKITEEIAKGHVKIIPDIIISGGGSDTTDGSLSGLMGMQLLNMMQSRSGEGSGQKPVATVTSTKSTKPKADEPQA